jgi:hypothetical protein
MDGWIHGWMDGWMDGDGMDGLLTTNDQAEERQRL